MNTSHGSLRNVLQSIQLVCGYFARSGWETIFLSGKNKTKTRQQRARQRPTNERGKSKIQTLLLLHVIILYVIFACHLVKGNLSWVYFVYFQLHIRRNLGTLTFAHAVSKLFPNGKTQFNMIKAKKDKCVNIRSKFHSHFNPYHTIFPIADKPVYC